MLARAADQTPLKARHAAFSLPWPTDEKSSGIHHPKPALILQMSARRPGGPQGGWVAKLIGSTGTEPAETLGLCNQTGRRNTVL